ncbi:hypothetical protein QWY84_10430 [Aquisalimonas lutea]|uniref:hypothetical protein n=1 Tax=Aquisalimonas lutea TaxID=1327750 RepID=UPI0025B508EF|nr:hypothetical protein [Aquisalimonas lutea]MDN3518025.1 hypothetical protein [Aquisalimonas lutea]
MYTDSTRPDPGPSAPAARTGADRPMVRALILRDRMPAATRRLLAALGVRIVAVHGPGLVGPAMDYVAGPAPEDTPDWLDAEGAEDLIAVLRAMERRHRTPQWVDTLLSRHRCGELLLADGSLELAGLLEPRRLIPALLG